MMRRWFNDAQGPEGVHLWADNEVVATWFHTHFSKDGTLARDSQLTANIK